MKKLILLLALTVPAFFLYAQKIEIVASGKPTSLRGLSVVNNKIAWVSGSDGWVASTYDGAITWQWQQLKGYEKTDFRDIEILNDKEIVLVSAGSPGVILKTSDAGLSWKETYRNDQPEIFLDGMDFYDQKQGIIFGDPIKNKMQLLKTLDGGNSWVDISNNLKDTLEEGEAGFAASGTTIRVLADGNTWIATGGKKSRIFHSADFGNTWKNYDCPIIQGEASTGPFSIAFVNRLSGVAVGGNYQKDSLRENVSMITADGGKIWKKPLKGTFGYRSAVEYIGKNDLVCTGSSGTDVSHDGGKSWKNMSKNGYNSVRKAKNGKLILLAGAKGGIAKLTEK